MTAKIELRFLSVDSASMIGVGCSSPNCFPGDETVQLLEAG